MINLCSSATHDNKFISAGRVVRRDAGAGLPRLPRCLARRRRAPAQLGPLQHRHPGLLTGCPPPSPRPPPPPGRTGFAFQPHFSRFAFQPISLFPIATCWCRSSRLMGGETGRPNSAVQVAARSQDILVAACAPLAARFPALAAALPPRRLAASPPRRLAASPPRRLFSSLSIAISVGGGGWVRAFRGARRPAGDRRGPGPHRGCRMGRGAPHRTTRITEDDSGDSGSRMTRRASRRQVARGASRQRRP